MFHDVVDPSINLGHKKQYTLPLSIGVHVLIVATLILVPLLAPGALPAPASAAILAFVTLPSVAPPPLPPAPARAREAQQPSPSVNAAAAPLEAPTELASEHHGTENNELVSSVENKPGSAGDGLRGVPGLVSGPAATDIPPPTPRVAPPPAPVGAKVKAPTKLKDVRPIYPVIAQLVKVQGIVIVEATIGPTGKVQDAKVLRSHPLLESAALDAVRQWEFTPTLLNGNPVPVVMTVTVDFRLR
jgi:periplasmic protein TonB